MRLGVLVEGEGDLSQCEAPRLDDMQGFHVLGSLVERAPGRLAATYDLVPDAGVRAVPPIRFAFFDTTPPAGYRTVESAPLAITVRASGPAALEAPSEPGAARRWPAWIALGFLALVVAILLRRRRRPAR